MNKGKFILFPLLVLLALAWNACKSSGRAQKSPENHPASEVTSQGTTPLRLEVGSLQVRDISGPGAKLIGFDGALRENLLSTGADAPEIRLSPGLDAPLVVEVLNACSGSGCQLVANATLSLPMDSGLRERFQVVVRIALDGIDYKPHVPGMGSQLRRGLFAEFRTRKASPEELKSWLMGSDALYVEAAIRSVAARKVVEAGPQIGALISSTQERVALLGIAAAGVLATSELLAPLEKAAMGINPNIADAAIQALADIGTAEAVLSLKVVEQSGATEPVRTRARDLQGATEDKLSRSSKNSDKHD